MNSLRKMTGPLVAVIMTLGLGACGEDSNNTRPLDAAGTSNGDAMGSTPPDTGATSSDAGPSLDVAPETSPPQDGPAAGGDAGPDAPIAAGCIKAIFGDHYIHTDGTIVHGAGGSTGQLIVDKATNLPLDGFVDGFESQWHACALRADHTVWCWAKFGDTVLNGALGNGQLGFVAAADVFKATRVQMPPQGLVAIYVNNAIAINGGSALYYHSNTCAILADNSVVCWGPKTDGDIVQTGTDTAFATLIKASANTPLTGVTQISVGRRHTCALGMDKAVRCWGSDIGAPLGQPVPGDLAYPTLVPGLPGGVTKVGAGMDSTCAQAGDRVYCWGASGRGQVGNGLQTVGAGCANYCTRAATLVESTPGVTLTGVAELYVVYLAACARMTDNTLWCWGAESGAADVQRAQPTSLVGKAVTDVGLVTAFGTSGFGSTLRYTTRAGDYYWSNVKIAPMCP